MMLLEGVAAMRAIVEVCADVPVAGVEADRVDDIGPEVDNLQPSARDSCEVDEIDKLGAHAVVGAHVEPTA